MAKQTDLNKLSPEQQLKAVGNYITVRERQAFSSGGLQDPYITEKQFLAKFKIDGGYARLGEIIDQFYSERHKRIAKSKLIRRLEEHRERETNRDVKRGLTIAIGLVHLNDSFIKLD